jgi:transcriptional regulator with XRE-family HTH domain
MKEFKSQRIKAALKNLLKKKGLTYDDLAEQLECSVPTVKRILGPEELTLNRLLQLCEIVDIDLAELETLIADKGPREERFTPAQEDFLAKNRGHFAYLMRLFDGDTPKKIAEKHGLTPRSSDKYLIALEKHKLIHVTGKQKVKPAFKSIPHFGSGPLAKAYSESFIKNGMTFFVNRINEALYSSVRKDGDQDKGTNFGIQVVRLSRASYEVWCEQQSHAMSTLEKLGGFEEKTKDPSELMTAVILDGRTQVPHDYAGLQIFEKTMGDITNI